MENKYNHPMSLLSFNKFIAMDLLAEGYEKPERKKLFQQRKFNSFFTKPEWDSVPDRIKYSGIVFVEDHVYVFCDNRIYYAGGLLSNYLLNHNRITALSSAENANKHCLEIFKMDFIEASSKPMHTELAIELFQPSKIN